jgi:hypothetical protein
VLEKSGIIELKRGKARDYSEFLLRRNPFPAVGVPTEAPLITVDREKDKERFQNVIGELLDVGTSIITVLVGEYGAGKSHLLKVFKQSINTQLLSRENGVLAAYVKSPGEDFRDFLLSMVEDVGRQLMAAYAGEVLRTTILSDPKAAQTHVINSDVAASLKKGEIEIGTFLAGCVHLDLIRELMVPQFKEVHSPDLLLSFFNLCHPDYSSKAWRWFLGEKLDRTDKASIGVETTIDDDETAYAIFDDLLTLFGAIGIKSLVALVDELEKITFISASKRSRYQDLLRRMIDDHTKNVCFYFAIAPRQWADLTKQSTAFVRRLAGNWYLLDDFQPGHTRDLIEQYLYSVRVGDFSAKKAKSAFPGCEPSLCPFTNDSIGVIQEISGGLVSSIILVCRKLLEYLYDYSKQYSSVTPELVRLVAEKEHMEKSKT